MKFISLYFTGITTSPWHVGKRQFGDYRYTRTDYLWGRAVRGSILTYLWRIFCSKSDVRERVKFNPDKDCMDCKNSNDCPFFNLRGSNDGEFKDTPKLIVTNVKFKNVVKFKEDIKPKRIAVISRNERHLSVVKGKSPVIIEYIPEGTKFEFEVILMGEGVRFLDFVKEAVNVTLEFFGWGGFRNEGFGRGKITNIHIKDYEEFYNTLRIEAEKLKEIAKNEAKLTFKIEPILLLDKKKGYYKSILENGFKEKFIHCLNERYWQFFRSNIYIPIKDISGRAKTIKIRSWSRKLSREYTFEGIGGEITLHIDLTEFTNNHFIALALAKYWYR